MSEHRRTLVGLIAGAVLGLLANAFVAGEHLDGFVTYFTEPIGKIFIRLLLMLVIPILFSALVLGVSELDPSHLKRLGLRTLTYTVVVSIIASMLGLVLVNVLRPGAGVSSDALLHAKTASANVAPPNANPADLVVAMVPDNPIRAAASGDMLALVVFSLLFGIGLLLVEQSKVATLRAAISGLFEVSMKLIELILRAAPIGVAALLFTATVRLGAGVLAQIAAYVGVVLLGLGLHLFGVYSLSLAWLCKVSPLSFFRDIRLALTTAFSTASSNATLPTALRVADENLRLPKHVSRFVLTAGASMNQNGTALFEGVTVLFLAQAYGVELGLGQQAMVMGICVLAGIGTAGVPAGSIPVIAMILTMLGVPAEGVGLIIGVDRLLDMCRTTVNVAGDLVAAVFVARGETPDDAAESSG
jgi:dicarboxylate/amino acid:cation (Na+ or H+) symporter, DAACS family